MAGARHEVEELRKNTEGVNMLAGKWPGGCLGPWILHVSFVPTGIKTPPEVKSV